GCSFHPRCQHANDGCTKTVPVLEKTTGSQEAACLRLGEF
ncbi:MAG: dipeptide/oligopeptide/nickel ABC transporter ATP-binding protein, partial [Verrucomicrobia bacterium]